MNDIQHNLGENLATPHQHEDSTAKTVLLQRHQAYLAKVDRITMVNRALCFAGLVAGALMLALFNLATACLFYAFVILLGLLWRVEASLATFRLLNLEEALVRAGGGEWEDHYIRAKGQIAGDLFQRFLLWIEPIAWMVIAALLIFVNIASAVAKARRENEKGAAVTTNLLTPGPEIRDWYRRLLVHPDDCAREAGAFLLGQLGYRGQLGDAVEAVVAELGALTRRPVEDDGKELQAVDAAIGALAEIGHPAGITHLRAVLFSDDEFLAGDSQWSAAEALGSLVGQSFMGSPDPVGSARAWLSAHPPAGTGLT